MPHSPELRNKLTEKIIECGLSTVIAKNAYGKYLMIVSTLVSANT